MHAPTTRRMPRTLALGLTGGLALFLGACAGPSSDRAGGRTGPQQDLAALQGRWEQRPEQPGGSAASRQKVIKEVSGNNETVTTYGPNGQVLQAQAATFSLSRSGPVGVYAVQNPRVTAGEGGSASPRSLAYVYRVHGDEFDEVWGLLAGQEEREVVVKRWKRERGSGAK